jgi:hypothetical protein
MRLSCSTRQHRLRQVIPRFGVENHEIALGFDHRSQVIERHVGAGLGVVEPPIGVFFDDDRLFLVAGGIRFIEHGLRFLWLDGLAILQCVSYHGGAPQTSPLCAGVVPATPVPARVAGAK